MSFGLGFWAAAGAGGAGNGPSYDLISSTILSSTATTISFSSIPSDYKHLQIRAVLRGTGNSYVQTTLRARLNSDTGNNYSSHTLTASGGAAGSTYSGATDYMVAANILDSSVSGTWCAAIIDLTDYVSTTKNKTLRSLNGIVDNNIATRMTLASSHWRNTSAITAISLFSSIDFAIGSRFSLYGIKG